MKKILTLLLLTASLQGAIAQDSLEISLQADILSRYIWRGTEIGGVSIQPMMNLNWQNANLTLCGNAGIDKSDPEEIDLSVGYTYNDFHVSLTDYWTSGRDYDGRSRYFFFEEAESAHQIELSVGYSYKQWLSASISTMLLGNDFKYSTHLESQYRVNGKHAYSTYIELIATMPFEGIDWSLTLGMTPFESAYTVDSKGQKQYFYADKFAVINTTLRATKTFSIENIEVPLFAELATNIHAGKAAFIMGMTIKL